MNFIDKCDLVARKARFPSSFCPSHAHRIETPNFDLPKNLKFSVLQNWQPIDDVMYEVPDWLTGFTNSLFLFGYLFLLTSTFAIDHFELFGLRQGLKMGNFLRFVPDGFVTQEQRLLVFLF